MRTLNKRIGPFCIKNVANVKVLPVSNPNYQLATGNTGIGNISTLATLTPAYSSTLTRRKNEAGEPSGVTAAFALPSAVQISYFTP